MPFELQPTLTSEILELRPLRVDDFERLYAVASDPLIWEQHPHSDRYQPDVFRKFFDGAIGSGGALLALDRKLDCVIGSSRFYATIRYVAKLRLVGLSWRDLIGVAFTTVR